LLQSCYYYSSSKTVKRNVFAPLLEYLEALLKALLSTLRQALTIAHPSGGTIQPAFRSFSGTLQYFSLFAAPSPGCNSPTFSLSQQRQRLALTSLTTARYACSDTAETGLQYMFKLSVRWGFKERDEPVVLDDPVWNEIAKRHWFWWPLFAWCGLCSAGRVGWPKARIPSTKGMISRLSTMPD
jgi:hypothetical protein